ncbi:MAG: carbohydrate-binding family 9-like protein [Ignavibacteriaceae bacterium]
MAKLFFYITLFSTLCFAQEIPVPAIDFSPEKYICYNSIEPLVIDGRLDELSWSKAEWTNYFVDIEGAAKPSPRFATRAKMLWDSIYFYVAAELEEPDIWATLKNRDDIIFYDNDFEVFIDPDGNTHGYCEFEMNAFNTVWDLFLIQPYRDIENASIHGWDMKGLKSGAAVYGTINKPGDKDSCWTVEIAFPWEVFKEITSTNVPPKNNDQWRVNFSRVEWQTEVQNGNYKKTINPATGKHYPEDNWVWSPQGVVNMHYPEMWGYVQFSTGIVGSGNAVFNENIEEKVKWFLRQIYYAEKKYFNENKTYTNDFGVLGVQSPAIKGFAGSPVIECTTNMFEAYLQSEDGAIIISIDDNGLVKRSK